jgi:hypothetical protein
MLVLNISDTSMFRNFSTQLHSKFPFYFLYVYCSIGDLNYEKTNLNGEFK